MIQKFDQSHEQVLQQFSSFVKWETHGRGFVTLTVRKLPVWKCLLTLDSLNREIANMAKSLQCDDAFACRMPSYSDVHESYSCNPIEDDLWDIASDISFMNSVLRVDKMGSEIPVFFTAFSMEECTYFFAPEQYIRELGERNPEYTQQAYLDWYDDGNQSESSKQFIDGQIKEVHAYNDAADGEWIDFHW